MFKWEAIIGDIPSVLNEKGVNFGNVCERDGDVSPSLIEDLEKKSSNGRSQYDISLRVERTGCYFTDHP